MREASIIVSLEILLKENPSLSTKYFPTFSAEKPLEKKELQKVLDNLSELIRLEKFTIRIAELFSPILLELLSRAKNINEDGSADSYEKHELFCIALSKLLWKFPGVGNFAKTYFENSRNLFWRFENEDHEPPAKKIKSETSFTQLLQAAYIYLIYDAAYFKDLWSWSVVAEFLSSEDVECRWYAYQCLCLVGKINDTKCSKILKNKFSDEEILKGSRELSLVSPLWSQKAFALNGMLLNECVTLESIKYTLSPDVVEVYGILLPKFQDVDQSPTDYFTGVPSVQRSLYSLALAVSASEPVLLQGVVGCGKTSIIDYLAYVTGRVRFENYFKVQLGDHMDSKTLLGTHCCTEIPGQFVWKPGILVQAMTEGHWLLLEDIDGAPMDVISLLVPVVQSRTILLPGQAAPIRAHPGFQLFTTQRLRFGPQFQVLEVRNNAAAISKQFRKIIMNSLTKCEARKIMNSKWSAITPVIERLIQVFCQFSADILDTEEHGSNVIEHLSRYSGRQISRRDLFKLCNRVNDNFNWFDTETAINVYKSVLDCFCESIQDIEDKIYVGTTVASNFNISKEKANYLMKFYKPAIQYDDNFVRIGTTELTKKPVEMSFTRSIKRTFANTRIALCLLEKVAVAIKNNEPVLLVGETGTGKTSIVQHLAELTNQKFTVINMSQQSDSVDLLGGYKPVDFSLIIQPIKEEFENLFCSSMDRDSNAKFMTNISSLFYRKSYKKLLDLMLFGKDKVVKFLLGKNTSMKHIEMVGKWKKFGEKVHSLKQHKFETESPLAFKFIEGALIKAMKNGEWLLLDEINLAEAETLESLAGVLENDDNTLLLLEKGDNEPVKRHPDFHIFACMNPATDVGKKQLPAGIRSRFTEYFVEELTDERDLFLLAQEYFKNFNVKAGTITNIVDFYIDIRKMASEKLTDGTGHHPHYSLRTLCRALSYASSNPCHNIPRSLYEAFCLSFLSQLDNSSHAIVTEKIKKTILEQKHLSILKQIIPEPKGGNHRNVAGYWIRLGDQKIEEPPDYIFTDTVTKNLTDLARIVSAGTYPVLLQGETSSGKTSLIQYLAKITGNICVRVNNHEHTDIQEYVGTYAADERGKLVFKEGILVQAMREGCWIILDELNLAPTEVMEALNRVLDDNRELFIAETQTLVRAQPGFMIFATQNPPGLYGGRKILSRAFRNRFIELHFNEIPPPELETILEKKCQLPSSYSKKLVSVMQELQNRRRESGVFAGKRGFITLRDLFRWGERYQHAPDPDTTYYNWSAHLAEEGYLLLAGRVRFKEEVEVIRTVIQRHFKSQIHPENLFNLHKKTSLVTKSLLERMKDGCESLKEPFDHIVLTYSMRRLAVLVGKAMQFEEPVLLVGNTG